MASKTFKWKQWRRSKNVVKLSPVIPIMIDDWYKCWAYVDSRASGIFLPRKAISNSDTTNAVVGSATTASGQLGIMNVPNIKIEIIGLGIWNNVTVCVSDSEKNDLSSAYIGIETDLNFSRVEFIPGKLTTISA